MATFECENCVWWRSAGSTNSCIHCCHHLLITGKRRKREGDKCLSRETKCKENNHED